MKREPSVMQTFRVPVDVDAAINMLMKRRDHTKKQVILAALLQSNQEMFNAFLGESRYIEIVKGVLQKDEDKQ